MSQPSAHIAGIGLAVPPPISTERFIALDRDVREAHGQPSEIHETAARKALADWGGDPSTITLGSRVRGLVRGRRDRPCDPVRLRRGERSTAPRNRCGFFAIASGAHPWRPRWTRRGTTPAVALTDYEKYIRTEELLALQKSKDELACHDELQFQIVHQVAELWMKLVEFELRSVCEKLAADDLAPCLHLLDRVSRIQRLLITQLDVLDTMSSVSYLQVRTALGRGSGQESPGFKTLLRLPGELVWPAVEAFLEKRGVTLKQIYDDPEANSGIYQLCEGLVDYDQLLQTWRYRHLMLVYRVIGPGTPSLKGKPSDLLAHGMKQRFFPALWEVRNEIFAEWTAEMAKKGQETGYHG